MAEENKPVDLGQFGGKDPVDAVWYEWVDAKNEEYPDLPVPRIYVRSALERNRPYYAALMKHPLARQAARSPAMLTKKAGPLRDLARKMYPKYIVVGWDEKTFVQPDGTPIPYSLENCRLVFAKVKDHALDELRMFVQDIYNFIEDGEEVMDEIDVEEQAENSKSVSDGKSDMPESEAQ